MLIDKSDRGGNQHEDTPVQEKDSGETLLLPKEVQTNEVQT